MLLLLASLYLLLGVLVSNAHASIGGYAVALAGWPVFLLSLGLRGRFAARLPSAG